jgi:hypothetical protein
MESFDAVFLGNGATAVAVMNHYLKKNNGVKNYLLVAEASDPEGAFLKGVKTVNLIVPKLPNIKADSSSIANYQSIITTLRGAAASLENVFDGRAAYSGKYEKGFRVCRSKTEIEILKALQGVGAHADDSMISEVGDFIEQAMGQKVDKTMLFPYDEKIWDVSGFVNLMTDRIPAQMIWDAEKVTVTAIENGINLTVTLENGEISVINARKLIVCKGAGNIKFENELRLKTLQPPAPMNFKVLPFAKIFYDGPTLMPSTVSSIMMPECGVCVTNEQANIHSLLYDTNTNPISTNSIDIGNLNINPLTIHEKLRSNYPRLPDNYSRAFNCAMTVDPRAYGSDFSRHFQFVTSSSAIKNIHYLNLPYFTVISAALQHLPDQLTDLQ